MSLAIYPGSFDPITKGHIDVLKKAVKIFDKVIIAVSINPAKTGMFSLEERVEMIKQSIGDLEKVEVDSFTGLTAEYARKKGARAIIRGLRAVSDFEYEMQMAQMNNSIYDEIETVFLVPKSKYNFISSSIVKEVSKLGGDISKFVTPQVKQSLIDYKNKR